MLDDVRWRPRKVRSELLALLGAVALACFGGGCSTLDHGQLATSALAPGKARIVMQRTNEQLHATSPATTKVNGAKVADVAAGATVIIDVAPGALALSVESWSYPGQYSIPLQVAAGETVKVEIAPRPSSTAGVLGPLGGFLDKDEQGNGGAFTVRQVANLDVPSSQSPAPVVTQ